MGLISIHLKDLSAFLEQFKSPLVIKRGIMCYISIMKSCCVENTTSIVTKAYQSHNSRYLD